MITILRLFIFILLITGSNNLFAQNLNFSGYMSNMESVMFQKADEEWIIDNLIHNRINFNYYVNDMFSINLELRNRVISGQTIGLIPDYDKLIDEDNGLVDLTFNLSSSDILILNSKIDRANITFEKGNLNIIAGRQRINWGQNYAWNPNDIFNSYSFFDIDYPEKPGSDAIRVQYYTGMASVVEVAVKADNNDNITGAGLVRFNKWNYDIQFMGGILNSEDYVLGFGWSGNLFSLGFRSETSYFKPIDIDSNTKEMIVSGVSMDYMFKNSLTIQGEFLYSQDAGDQTGNLMEYYNKDLSAKTLALSEYSVMASINYPVNPLLNGTISTMYFPDSKGFFIGPSLDYSLSDNISASIFAQYFDISLGGYNTTLSMLYFRIKGNF